MRELLDRRARLVAEARSILDGAEQAGRGLNADEETRYNALMGEISRLTADIQRREQLESIEREQPAGEQDAPGGAPEMRSRGMMSLRPGWSERDEWREMIGRIGSAEYARRFNTWMYGSSMERRALQADADVYGGYLYAPMQFVDQLIQAVDNLVYIRQWANVMAVTDGESLGAPSLDNDPADPAWTSELLIGSEDSTMSFGIRELNPHPLAKYIKISRKLLRKAPSVEGLVMNRLAYKFAVAQENSFLTGDGTGQALGVFTASAAGINTDRDYSTGNTTTEIRFDGLIGAKYTLKPQYWPRARWLFHRDGVAQIAKLKDGEGQYIWRESVRVGEPDRILNMPVFMSEYAPNTFTTALYVGILGDWSYYWIADSLAMEMQRLDELYAATNQVGFIGRLETDGMPVLSEAFVRVKLA